MPLKGHAPWTKVQGFLLFRTQQLWNRSSKTSVISADPTIGGIFAQEAGIFVGLSGLCHDVRVDRITFLFHVDAVNFRSVQPENFGFVRLGDLGIAEFLAEFVADLEALKSVN